MLTSGNPSASPKIVGLNKNGIRKRLGQELVHLGPQRHDFRRREGAQGPGIEAVVIGGAVLAQTELVDCVDA
jgi:hypothetical protein